MDVENYGIVDSVYQDADVGLVQVLSYSPVSSFPLLNPHVLLLLHAYMNTVA